MLNWFGHRKSDGKPTYRGARDVIARLVDPDAVKNIVAVATALDALTNNTDLSIADRFDEIQMLDAAAQPRLFGMTKEYLATPRHKKVRESQLWGGAYNYLQELYNAYLFCLQRYEADPQGSTRFRLKLPITVARALRALRLQLKWTLLRYITPEPRLWTEMAGLYAFAVSNGIAEEEVLLYPGRHITVREEFVKGLMIAACSNDSLRPAELDVATRLVDHYSAHFVIADHPFEGCTHWFDIHDPRSPVRTAKVPPENTVARYIGAGAALVELETVRAQIAYTGVVPKELLFYEKQDDQLLLAALNHLALDWAGKTQARKDERGKITSRVTVVPGLPEIFRALDFAVNDSLDFTDQLTAESWVVEDTSAGGYGAVIPAIAGDWVEVGSLLGIEGSSIRDWRIGVIRRVNRLQGDRQRVGVQLLGSGAALVTLRQKDARVEATSDTPYPVETAVLISRNPESQNEVEVMVRSGVFTSMNDSEMILGDKQFRLKPVRIEERSASTERVTLKVLASSSVRPPSKA